MAIEVDAGKIETIPANELNAYCYVDPTSGTPVIQKQQNVSSITDNGVGNYVVNFTNALASTDFSVGGFAENDNGGDSPATVYGDGSTARTTTSLPVMVSINTPTRVDWSFSLIVVGA